MVDKPDAGAKELEDSLAAERLFHESQAKDGTKTAECPVSPAYDRIIEQVINTIYEPKVIKDKESLLSRYNCQIKSEDQAVAYAKKAVEALNYPYTRVFDKKEADEIRTEMSGRFYGIGVDLKETSGHEPGKGRVSIGSMNKDGAAAEAGLKPGDAVLEINGQNVAAASVQDVAALIKSDKPEPFKITVERDGQVLNFENVQRKIVETPAVNKTQDINGIVHISVSTFEQDDTAQELKQAIEANPKAKAFIIDLRQNTGGLVDQSLKALSLFMSEGKLMEKRERVDGQYLAEDDVSYYKSKVMLNRDKIEIKKSYENMPEIKLPSEKLERYPQIVKKPVVVLVDGRTASASEIFTAAMQDSKRATVIGSNTYGKGIAQTYDLSMPYGSWLSVTNIRLFTPKGNWLGDGRENKIGIKPDIEVKAGQDPLQVSVDYLRRVLGPQAKKKS